jgi:hypothetical protein
MRRKRQFKTAGKALEPLARPGGPESCLDRWSQWSKSIATRRVRTVPHRYGLPFTLLGRAGAVLNLSHRTIAPQFHLHLAPIIRESRTRLPEPRWRRTVRVERSLPARIIGDERLQSARSRFEQILASHNGPVRLSPVQHVIRRVEQTEMATALHKTMSLNRALSLTRRLVEERRRVDLSPRAEAWVVGSDAGVRSAQNAPRAPGKARAMLEQASGRAALVLNRSAGPERSTEHSGSPVVRKGLLDREQSSVNPPAPAINMEQITEHVIRQIDSRLIAYRERMGRPGV